MLGLKNCTHQINNQDFRDSITAGFCSRAQKLFLIATEMRCCHR